MFIGGGINIAWCLAFEALVRPINIIPQTIAFDFLAEAVRGERDRDESDALVLERADEPFDDGDGAVMADGAKALFDV